MELAAMPECHILFPIMAFCICCGVGNLARSRLLGGFFVRCASLRRRSRRLKAGGWSFYIFLRFSFRASTKCGAGAFACQPSMFYRRKLPHWHPDVDEATFLFVTWRLDGSIPQIRWPPRLAGESACPTPQSAGRAFLALDREADKAAFGPVWLRDARVADVVAHALLYGESGR